MSVPKWRLPRIERLDDGQARVWYTATGGYSTFPDESTARTALRAWLEKEIDDGIAMLDALARLRRKLDKEG